MKTIKHHDDGIEWLRQLRGQIAARCGHNLKKQSAFYRQVAAKYSYKIYQGELPAVRTKRPAKLAA